MMAMTTRSSTKVKANRRFLEGDPMLQDQLSRMAIAFSFRLTPSVGTPIHSGQCLCP